jgi:hypothetical protein
MQTRLNYAEKIIYGIQSVMGAGGGGRQYARCYPLVENFFGM